MREKTNEQQRSHTAAVDLLLKETLTTADLAEVLGVSVATVEQLRGSGRIAFVEVTPDKFLYRIDHVREFINNSVKIMKGGGR